MIKKIFITVIVLFLATFLYTVWSDTNVAMKAYSEAVDEWTEARKDAAFSLKMYGATNDKKDYNNFLDFLKIPLGYKTVREQLEKMDPNEELLTQAFVEGGTLPENVKKMSLLLRRLKRYNLDGRILDMWIEGDLLISGLERLGSELHGFIAAGEVPGNRYFFEEKEDILVKIATVNDKLIVLENDFIVEINKVPADVRDKLNGIIPILLAVLFVAVLISSLFGKRTGENREKNEQEARPVRPKGLVTISGETTRKKTEKDGTYNDEAGVEAHEEVFGKSSAGGSVTSDRKKAEEILSQAIKQARMAGRLFEPENLDL